MKGSFALVLHAHLPFVRHPEHDRSLEETWLFEALTESYIPLLQCLQRLTAEDIRCNLTFSITPTLASMLQDRFLQERYFEHLNRLIELAELECHRTAFLDKVQPLARFYLDRLLETRRWYERFQGDLPKVFRELKERRAIEIISSSATHAVLPLLRHDAASLRAQVFTGRDTFTEMFGSPPNGFWLPECAWASELESVLSEAGIRWTILDSHGILGSRPKPRFGLFAPIITPNGIAVFGRDPSSARQVWSRDEGYPGDPCYRDFYRDIGFDLDMEYVQPFLPVRGRRGFTGIKYHRITGKGLDKEPYDRDAALDRVREHAKHFIECRLAQLARLEAVMDHAIVVCPYDAELFGHWWFEGPEFIEAVIRRAHNSGATLTTPGGYLQENPRHQQALPADSSWGERGYWSVWLNEKNHWITSRLGPAQDRMRHLAPLRATFDAAQLRALKQAGRELLLAQASDWPFIIRTGTSPDYAARRVMAHLLRFWRLCDQIEKGSVDMMWLESLERTDDPFPNLEPAQWA